MRVCLRACILFGYLSECFLRVSGIKNNLLKLQAAVFVIYACMLDYRFSSTLRGLQMPTVNVLMR